MKSEKTKFPKEGKFCSHYSLNGLYGTNLICIECGEKLSIEHKQNEIR